MKRQQKSWVSKDPIGKAVTSGDGSKFRIIGVVKDFHFKSLHTKIEPLIMFMYRERVQLLYQNET